MLFPRPLGFPLLKIPLYMPLALDPAAIHIRIEVVLLVSFRRLSPLLKVLVMLPLILKRYREFHLFVRILLVWALVGLLLDRLSFQTRRIEYD